MSTEMTSGQRVVMALGHKEPDRVPFFLPASFYPAREMGISIREYFSRPENVVEGQMRFLSRYHHDIISALFYAAIEVEAWGGEIVFYDDGPPNAGAPFIRKPEDILRLEPPRIGDSPCLVKVLRAIEMLKARVGDEVPIVAIAVSPFSAPPMQMGFASYFDLMYERPELFERLMSLNENFCVEWANAQLEAGAATICYFDPVSSPTIVPREIYLKTGFQIARRTISRIKGPTGTHLASGRSLPILDDLAQTGTLIIGTSALEDLAEVKAACRGKLTILGNLNAIEMRRWTPEEAEAAVKDAIAKAGPGGGFILADNHGEIPWQVPEEVLESISQAVQKWGGYPLDWVEGHNGG
ncbi:MAG: uroporphyrinogen decarboxylase family protein [Chloroflexi bacterium]|nr:uroporphyrinogen decarboxylase family protein [Chloroflexota bacterium]